MTYYIVDGVLYRKDHAPKEGRIPVELPSDGELMIPAGVSRIDDQAFAWLQKLTRVVIPEGVTSIGESAFIRCEGVTSVELPESLTVIDRWAFEHCSSLRSVVIPSGVESIEELTFGDCRALEKVVIKNGMRSIKSMAFFDCRALKYAGIPQSVRVIWQEAFGGCENLSVVIPESVRSIDDNSFRGCKSVVVPEKFWWNLSEETIKSVRVLACPVSVKEAPSYARMKLCAGFAQNEDMYDGALRAEYLEYIKKNAGRLCAWAFQYPELLHLMCREKLIAARHIDAYIDEAQKHADVELTAAILDYQASALTAKEISKARAKKEQIREQQDETVISRMEARADKAGIDGLNFAATGRLKHFAKREDIKAFITGRGGRLLSAMSAKTDYLITNDTDSGSEKNRKAAELGIVVITEDEFLAMAEGKKK